MSNSFAAPWTIVHQAPLSMGFSRQEYWSGLPFLSPGDLPDPGIKPPSPSLQADSLPLTPGKPFVDYKALFKEENFLLLSSLLEKTFPPLLCTSNSCPDCSAGLFVFCYPVVTKQNFGSEDRTRLTCPILSWLVSPVSCVRSCVHVSLCPAQPWECKPRVS